MDILRWLLGERKQEGVGFRKAFESSMQQETVVVREDLRGALAYRSHAAFFVNPEETIAYMDEKVEEMEVRIPQSAEVEDDLKARLGELNPQRIIAYSVCADGTEVLTGNLGFEVLDQLFGRMTVRIGGEAFLDGRILRSMKQRKLNSILRRHKSYVRDLEIVSDPKLAERFAETYKQLNTYLTKL